MFVALWEVFLEGFSVVLAVGVVTVGGLVLVFLARGGVLASVVLASVVLSVGAAVVGVWLIIAAVVLNGPVAAGGVVAVPVPVSSFVAVMALTVVIALAAAAVVVGVVPAGVVAAVSVLFWVCESGVVSQGWGGEVVEGRSGVWGGWGVVGCRMVCCRLG